MSLATEQSNCSGLAPLGAEMGLADTARAYWTGWKFKRTPLGQALARHTQDYFYSRTALSSFSQGNKDRLVADFYGKVFGIGGSPDPAMALRESLAEYVLLYAGLTVLCLKTEEKSATTYCDNPYITGEIHHRIVEAAAHNDEMAQFAWANPDTTPDDLISFANARSALMLYYANGLNMVRIDIGDTDPQKDWYRPFVEAAMVWEEDLLREKLDMPRLVPGLVHGLPYSTYLNMVLNGERNPFFAWTKQWPDRYLAGEGPLSSEDDRPVR